MTTIIRGLISSIIQGFRGRFFFSTDDRKDHQEEPTSYHDELLSKSFNIINSYAINLCTDGISCPMITICTFMRTFYQDSSLNIFCNFFHSKYVISANIDRNNQNHIADKRVFQRQSYFMAYDHCNHSFRPGECHHSLGHQKQKCHSSIIDRNFLSTIRSLI